jgi:hypothetical protein
MKGLLFTLLVVAITLSLVSYFFLHRGLIMFYAKKMSIEIRVNSMLSFYEDIVSDVNKALKIIARRAMVAAVGEVIAQGIGLTQANVTLAELILNGSIDAEPIPLMENATIKDWKLALEAIGLERGFHTQINISNLNVMPWDSWNLLLKLKLYVGLIDQKGVANLTRSEEVKTLVGIEGIEDPLYPLHTLGRAVNAIIKSSHIDNYTTLVEGELHIENFVEHVANSWYAPSLSGASFLDRLEGKIEVQPKYQTLTPNVIGIESFINKTYFLELGLPVNVEKSNVDHWYFSNITATTYRVEGMHPDFRIDNETCLYGLPHPQVYGIDELLIV